MLFSFSSLTSSLSRYFLIPALFFSISAKDFSTQIENYLKGINFISADFEQILNTGKIYEGHFWLAKRGKTKAKIEYTKGLNQDIFINDAYIIIIDKKTNKKYTNLISQTPIYSVLTGRLNLSKEKYKVIENNDKILRLSIEKSSSFGGISIMLIFSKYQNGNIKNLEAWIINDGKNETLFSFDPENLSVNDEKKVPESIFTLKNR